MGFRSTLVTTDDGTWKWPSWFIERYGKYISGGDHGGVGVGDQTRHWEQFCEDIQLAVPWDGFTHEDGEEASVPDFVGVAILHECGGVTRAEIRKDGITYLESWDWWPGDGYACGTGCGSPCRGGAGAARRDVERLEADCKRHRERGDELARQLSEAVNGPRKPPQLPEDLQLLADLDALRGRISTFLAPEAWAKVRDAWEPVRLAVLLQPAAPQPSPAASRTRTADPGPTG